MDHLSKDERSRNMSKIRSKNTKPEICVRSLLHKMGFRFRLHRKDLPGKPDIVLPKHNTAVFIHGCFWHRHPGCKRATLPKSNQEYWHAKLKRNVIRGEENVKQLKEMNWRVLIIWECETKKPETLKEKIEKFFLYSPIAAEPLIAAEEKNRYR